MMKKKNPTMFIIQENDCNLKALRIVSVAVTTKKQQLQADSLSPEGSPS
ncbi:hypothetical protein [Arachidicoccus soli]|nr:hypothetical protein [Arachidicoccus soli]